MINLIKECYKNISPSIIKTPLQYSERLSNFYNTNIYLKREDLQKTRSFKIRGNLNKIHTLLENNKNNKNIEKKGFICASAGNHAQGFSYICNKMNIDGIIYVPKITPLQKVNRIKYYGGEWVKVIMFGNNFDDCLNKSVEEAEKLNRHFVHPYDDYDIINGQSTLAYEIYEDLNPDFIISPVGGAGLISGISQYSKEINIDCKIIGIEPEGAESLKLAFNKNKPIKISDIDTFVDGASVPIVGSKTFNICRKNIDKLYTVSNKKICFELVNCYQDDGIILEPAGVLSIAALDKLNKDYNLRNKNIVCVLSGGNNDITRYGEIMQLNLEYMGLVHYFILEFNQNPGILKFFINNILKDNIDIIRFEYIKKTNKNYGKVLLGIQLPQKDELSYFKDKLTSYKINFKKIEYNDLYYDLLV